MSIVSVVWKKIDQGYEGKSILKSGFKLVKVEFPHIIMQMYIII